MPKHHVEKRNAFIGVHSSDLDAHQGGAVCTNSTGSTTGGSTAVAKVTSLHCDVTAAAPSRLSYASTMAPANCALYSAA